MIAPNKVLSKMRKIIRKSYLKYDAMLPFSEKVSRCRTI